MSKEAKRIAKQVEVNGLQNIVNKVKVDNLAVFTSCFNKIKIACPDTVVMITADKPITKKQKDNVMYVATYIPERAQGELDGWLEKSIEYVIRDGDLVTHVDEPESKIVEITYPAKTESVSSKLVDTVNGSAFGVLKKVGLYQEDEESSDELFDF